jgi:predicted metal-binding membrane protein
MDASMDAGMGAGMGDGQGEAVGGLRGVMAMAPAWTPTDFLLTFFMWSVMMVGMMVPSAAPMILLYALIARKQRDKGVVMVPVGLFTLGYIAVWSAFSLTATTLQWGLEQAALLSPMMVATSPLLGGGLLVAAGVYQMTPFKNACLHRCRSPLAFLTTGWRKGPGGAIVMGLEHGAFCLGCCWVIMLLLFVGGVMNLLWVAIIAIFVLVEKVLPQGRIAGRAAGAALVLAGLFFLYPG